MTPKLIAFRQILLRNAQMHLKAMPFKMLPCQPEVKKPELF